MLSVLSIITKCNRIKNLSTMASFFTEIVYVCVSLTLPYKMINANFVLCLDVKPSNVLIGKDGSIKMCDFGIAGVTINSECHTRGIGCKAYMAVSDCV